MTQVLDLIQGEPLSLIVTVVLFAYVGNWAVGGHQKVRAWGWRLALIAFVAYVAYAVSLHGLSDSGLLAAAAFRGLLAGGLVLGTSWIALAVLSFLFGNVVGSASARLRHLDSRRDQQRWEHERQRSEEELRRQDRDRAATELRTQQQKEQREQQHKQEQQRRKDARFACERFYDRYRARLAQQFPQSRLDEYIKRYLSDDHPADEVDQQAQQLRTMLQEFLDEDAANHRPVPKSLLEVREPFRQDRQQIIDDPSLEKDTKQSILADLARDEELAIREFRQR